jgi:formylglycine-generating enzyme required for sulfatase activity
MNKHTHQTIRALRAVLSIAAMAACLLPVGCGFNSGPRVDDVRAGVTNMLKIQGQGLIEPMVADALGKAEIVIIYRGEPMKITQSSSIPKDTKVFPVIFTMARQDTTNAAELSKMGLEKILGNGKGTGIPLELFFYKDSSGGWLAALTDDVGTKPSVRYTEEIEKFAAKLAIRNADTEGEVEKIVAGLNKDQRAAVEAERVARLKEIPIERLNNAKAAIAKAQTEAEVDRIVAGLLERERGAVAGERAARFKQISEERIAKAREDISQARSESAVNRIVAGLPAAERGAVEQARAARFKQLAAERIAEAKAALGRAQAEGDVEKIVIGLPEAERGAVAAERAARLQQIPEERLARAKDALGLAQTEGEVERVVVSLPEGERGGIQAERVARLGQFSAERVASAKAAIGRAQTKGEVELLVTKLPSGERGAVETERVARLRQISDDRVAKAKAAIGEAQAEAAIEKIVAGLSAEERGRVGAEREARLRQLSEERVARAKVGIESALLIGQVEEIVAGLPEEEKSLVKDLVDEKITALGKSKIVTLADGVAMELVAVPAGTGIIGEPKGKPRNEFGEEMKLDKLTGTQRRVTMTRTFYLGKTEVTQEQYVAVTGKNPARFKGRNRPVEGVRWDDATAFCKKLTEQERAAGRLPEGYAYTLPTEEQWEYACRAGSTGDYGNVSEGTEGKLEDMGWYEGNSGNRENGRRETHDVGQKQPNAWGLYDMHGNVSEWCLDFARSEGIHVWRGGDYANSSNDTRAYSNPFMRNALGFRVALAPLPVH